ncbi:hypothetical protein ABW19_dt0208074 [Dactylella cylindrospora]|nr:hypothetical protein ABW19_dt0208074 [Dactylella cylindrospora]
MPQTPEPSPFKRPATSFGLSPRPDGSSNFTESRYHNDKKGNPTGGILSPPPSPFIARQLSEIPSDLGPSIHNRDPVLYDTPISDDNHQPLFGASETNDSTFSAVAKRPSSSRIHVQQVDEKLQRQISTFLKFRAAAWQDCFRNPSDYLRRERLYLKQQATAAKAARVSRAVFETPVKALTPSPKKIHQRSRSTGSENSIPRKEKIRIHRNADNKVAKPKFSRQSRPVTTTRKDIHFSTVEDVTPSIDLLPDNLRCLHVDWSGAPLDISNDPDRHLLHKAEQHLASTLKLSCGQYLTQKRLIFLERVTRLRAGNTVFSRTHAQQVCHIDVNKASRLFAAFEKVGWLSPQALKQHL